MDALLETPSRMAGGSGSIDLGHGLILNAGPALRFAALSDKERDRILDAFQEYLGRALEGVTMEGYLADRRREAESDA